MINHNAEERPLAACRHRSSFPLRSLPSPAAPTAAHSWPFTLCRHHGTWAASPGCCPAQRRLCHLFGISSCRRAVGAEPLHQRRQALARLAAGRAGSVGGVCSRRHSRSVSCAAVLTWRLHCSYSSQHSEVLVAPPSCSRQRHDCSVRPPSGKPLLPAGCERNKQGGQLRLARHLLGHSRSSKGGGM